MSIVIDTKDYWPFWDTVGKLRRFDYKAIDGSMPPITSVFAYDQGMRCMKLFDYDAHLTLNDIWFYDYRPGKGGVAEFRDDYPQKGKKVVMDGMFGRPIFWGDVVEIGSSSVNYPKMNPIASSPPAFSGGVQCLAFEALLPSMTLTNGQAYTDVLQFSYMQAWDGHPGAGARYWMSRGIGPIALAWMAQDPTNPTGKPLIVTSRMDATISDVDNSALIS